MTTTHDTYDTATGAQRKERDEFAREWRAWHREHEKNRASDTGFLAITGLYWLSDAPVTLPDAPGTWTTSDRGPVVDVAPSESLSVNGTPIEGRYEFGPIPERGGVNVEFDGGIIEVARRGGRDLLRPRLANAAFLGAYQGNPAYEPDPAWRVDATFVRYDSPRAITVGASVDDIEHVYDAPGELQFEIDGTPQRLIAFPGHAEGSLMVLFTDQTSGVTTYGANRVIAVGSPDADDRTTLDFNRAVNLPCAHTDFATCPLPPAENRLPVAVEAGEKLPTSRLVGTVTDFGIVPAGAS